MVARTQNPREYPAQFSRTVDGDTYEVNIDLGFHDWLHDFSIRLRGYDTHEMHDKNEENRKKARMAKAIVEDFLINDAVIMLKVYKTRRNQYEKTLNRWVADIFVEGHWVEDKYVDGRHLGEVFKELGLLKDG